MHTSAHVAAQIRGLTRACLVASLATVDHQTGAPFASLIATATTTGGAPLFLISALAWHTKNLLADERASILVTTEQAGGDPLAQPRVTLIGHARVNNDTHARARFLARHPSAASYADFGDFALFQLDIARAHFVGGFGRIQTVSGEHILLDPAMALIFAKDEAKLVAELNTRYTALIQRLAVKRSGRPSLSWRICGIDPEGCDLIGEVQDQESGDLPAPAVLRIEFGDFLKTSADVRNYLVQHLDAH